MDITTLTTIVVNLVVAVLIGVAGYLVAELLARMTHKVARRFLDEGLSRFLTNVVRVGALLFTLKLIVDQTGAAGLLVVVVTALTGAFAIGSERLASDFVAGINLFMLRYYKVGDYVTIGDYDGEVKEITLTHTALGDWDRNKIIIPNSEAVNQIIINHTSIPGTRLTVFVTLFGQQDAKEAVRVLEEAALKFEPQLRGPDDHPSAVLYSIEPLSVTYRVRVFVSDAYAGSEPKLLTHLYEAVQAHNFKTQLSLNSAEALLTNSLQTKSA